MAEHRAELVIVDTNVLFTEDKKEITNIEFRDFFDEYAKEFNLELIIPEVVKGELKFQHTKFVLKRLSTANYNIKEIADVTGQSYKHRITEDRIKKDVQKKFELFLKNYKAVVVPTPIKTIDWQKIINNSIWRVPPFTDSDKKEEKGFRDALILATIIHYCKTVNIYQTVSFICKDRLLREAAERDITKTNFNVYESISDFKSTLDLRKQNLELLFIKKISRRAKDKFFKRYNSDSLFYRENMDAMLREKYGDYINDPERTTKHKGILSNLFSNTNEESWEPTNYGSFWVYRPSFEKVENDNEYYWLNVVEYVRKYRRKNIKLENQNNEFNEERIHILTFHITWWSRLSKDGKFLEYRFISEELKGAEFRAFTDDDIRKFSLNN